MGGMRALEWAVVAPERVGAALVLATSASASAEQIATQTTQSTAISSDAGWQGGDYYDAAAGSGPHRGLGLARRIAHLTYRSAEELEARFGAQPQPGEDPLLPGGRYAVQSYLEHHGDKLSRRFDAGSYVVLTDAMTTWDVGRGAAEWPAALGRLPGHGGRRRRGQRPALPDRPAVAHRRRAAGRGRRAADGPLAVRARRLPAGADPGRRARAGGAGVEPAVSAAAGR
jgi:hypothetical protein